MFYELRRYQIFPGKMNEWVEFMEGTIIPFQVARGMVITGSFTSEEDDTTYFWTRRFNSEEEKQALYEKVYKDDEWVNVIGPRVAELMDTSSVDVTRIVPTPRSVTQ